jgi:hypothetical protein
MCFQLPKSLVQNLQPSKLLRSASQSKQVWLGKLWWRIGGWGARHCIWVWWWFIIVPICIIYVIVYINIFLVIISKPIVYILVIYISIILGSVIATRQG